MEPSPVELDSNSKATPDRPTHLQRLSSVHDSIPEPETVSRASDVFSLLGDPGRLRILSALYEGELNVRDLAAITHQSQSSVSHSLRLLRLQNVVSASKRGREVFYLLNDEHVRRILELTFAHARHGL